jgi:hypothetical protein
MLWRSKNQSHAEMHRRTRPTRRKSSPLRWLGGLAALTIIAAITLNLLAPTLVTRFIRAYVQKETFREKAAELIAAKTGGEAHLDSLTWNDDNALVSEMQLEGAHGWDVEAVGLHAALDFGAIRNGMWSIHSAGADELTLRRQPAATRQNPAGADSATINSDAVSSIPSFLRRHIPTKTEISGFDVRHFNFEQAGWKITETDVKAAAWESGKTSVPVKLSGGSLQTPFKAPEQAEALKLDLVKATLRVTDEQIQLSDATLRWKQSSEATLRGSVKFETGAWQTFTHVQAVPLDEFLNAWWKQRLSGKVKGDLEFSGSRNMPVAWKADAVLENGVLQGLPVLEKLATYTHVERFKRLVLDICQASFRPEGDALRIEKIIVQSNGLLRIEGTMTLRGRMMEGDFMVGVTPETLKAIPGADSLIFTQTNPNGPPGLLWTSVHVAGPLDAPQEDLSSRLIGGVGMSLLFDTPGKIVNQGAETLLKPVLGEDAAKIPSKVIEGASGLLENGVKTGAGILNQVLPILPQK